MAPKDCGLPAWRTELTSGRSAPNARPRAYRRKLPSTATSQPFVPWSGSFGSSARVSARLKAKDIAGSTVTVKLKTSDFRLRTRARSLTYPTQLATRIFAAGRDLLARETDGTSFRLIGIGVSALGAAQDADPVDLVDRNGSRLAAAEHAMDRLRSRYGDSAVVKGLVFEQDET
jgi:hypothetical protein